MKINFVLPSLSLHGGIRVVFEFCNRLKQLGHEITVIYPVQMDPHAKIRIRDRLRAYTDRSHPDWFDLSAETKLVPNLSGRYIPNADVSLATLWKTAEWVNTYPPEKGVKFYLVQSYEAWAGPRERVDETYRVPLLKIVTSTWLKEILRKKFQVDSFGPVVNGVNFEHFFNDKKVYNTPRRIGMMYSNISLKGSGDAIKAFEIAKQRHPDLRLVMFGLSWPGLEVPEDAEFHYNPPQELLRKIYSSCDIWLCSSWYEGCHLPPAEAMACKCALVTTDVGGIRDYTIPEQTALVSPIRDPEALAENLIRLLDNEEELKRISMAGYEKIKEFTWDRATDQLEQILVQGAP